MLIVRLMDIFNAYLIFLMNNIFLTQIKNKWNFMNRRIQYLMDMQKRELLKKKKKATQKDENDCVWLEASRMANGRDVLELYWTVNKQTKWMEVQGWLNRRFRDWHVEFCKVNETLYPFHWWINSLLQLS